MQSSNAWVTVYVPLASTLVTALATVVLAWLTARYVRLTSDILEQSRRAQLPSVSLDFEMPDRSLRLPVANHGGSAARTIRFEILKDVAWLRRMKETGGLSALSPFKSGICYLASERRLKYEIGYPDWKNVSAEEMTVAIRVVYADQAGKERTDVVNYDFSQMREVLFESFQDPTRVVAQAIRDAESHRHSSERLDRMFSGGLFRGVIKKACPMCGETVSTEAKKCPHWHEMIVGTNVSRQDGV